MHVLGWFLCYVGAVSAYLSASKGPEVKEYCQEESLAVACQATQVVLMESASFGRLRIGRCVKRNLGYLPCHKDALRLLDSRCSGQTSCDVSIMDAGLRQLKPCLNDVTWHLEAAYRCVDVRMGSSYECQTRKYSPLADPSGYLSSAVAYRTSVGSSSCPWRIRVDPDQRINVTLLNFVSVWATTGSGTEVPATSGSGSAAGSGKSGELCYDVAVIRDGSARRSVTACSSEARMRNVYVSAGSAIDVEFSVRNVLLPSVSTPSVQFLIYYEVVGCVALTTPVGASVTRDKDTVTFKCNSSGDMWSLTCDGSRWIGIMNNCSTQANHVWNGEDIFGQPGFPLGILIVVAVGVALGVFLGGTLLLLASMLMRRQRLSQRDVCRDGATSDDLKSSEDVDYCDPCAREPPNPKHYIVQDYAPKDYIGGQTSDCPGFEADYDVGAAAVTRDRMIRGGPGAPQQKTMASGLHQTSPRILYHVYESSQLT